jgi:two-component system, NarL family, response regulator DesR
VRLVLADDDMHVRSAVHLLLAEEPCVQVVADCWTGAGLVHAIEEHKPDVALVDWELPGLRAREIPLMCRVVAMSGRPDQRQAALRAGAVGFVCKGDAPDTLLAVLRELVGVAIE